MFQKKTLLLCWLAALVLMVGNAASQRPDLAERYPRNTDSESQETEDADGSSSSSHSSHSASSSSSSSVSAASSSSEEHTSDVFALQNCSYSTFIKNAGICDGAKARRMKEKCRIMRKLAAVSVNAPDQGLDDPEDDMECWADMLFTERQADAFINEIQNSEDFTMPVAPGIRPIVPDPVRHNEDDLPFLPEEELPEGVVPEQRPEELGHPPTRRGARRRKRKVRVYVPAYAFRKWDVSRPIKYKIDSSIGEVYGRLIKTAVDFWSERTCISFERIELDDMVEEPHIFFVYTQIHSCFSYVGQMEDSLQQPIFLSVHCFDMIGTITHEIGHTLGLYHEHQRRDRDQYIVINEDYIRGGSQANFAKVPDILISNLGLPYDYASGMHYREGALSRNSMIYKTIETVDDRYQKVIGQRVEMSFFDVKAINLEYCEASCTRAHTARPCQHHGYQHPRDCTTCLCPDGWGGPYCERVADSTGLAVCGGDLQASSRPQQQTNPFYGQTRYDNHDSCSWLIRAPRGSYVRLWFEDTFKVSDYNNRCKHWVEVRWERDLGLTGPRFCGDSTPTAVMVSETQEMLVIFRSPTETSASSRYGFKFMYEAVTEDEVAAVSTTPRSTTTEITTTTEPTTTPTTPTTTPTTTTTTERPRRTRRTRRPTTPTTTSTTTPTTTTTTTTTRRPPRESSSSSEEDEDLDQCADVCYNDGWCSLLRDTPICWCSDGYSGELCEATGSEKYDLVYLVGMGQVPGVEEKNFDALRDAMLLITTSFIDHGEDKTHVCVMSYSNNAETIIPLQGDMSTRQMSREIRDMRESRNDRIDLYDVFYDLQYHVLDEHEHRYEDRKYVPKVVTIFMDNDVHSDNEEELVVRKITAVRNSGIGIMIVAIGDRPRRQFLRQLTRSRFIISIDDYIDLRQPDVIALILGRSKLLANEILKDFPPPTTTTATTTLAATTRSTILTTLTSTTPTTTTTTTTTATTRRPRPTPQPDCYWTATTCTQKCGGCGTREYTYVCVHHDGAEVRGEPITVPCNTEVCKCIIYIGRYFLSPCARGACCEGYYQEDQYCRLLN